MGQTGQEQHLAIITFFGWPSYFENEFSQHSCHFSGIYSPVLLAGTPFRAVFNRRYRAIYRFREAMMLLR